MSRKKLGYVDLVTGERGYVRLRPSFLFGGADRAWCEFVNGGWQLVEEFRRGEVRVLWLGPNPGARTHFVA